MIDPKAFFSMNYGLYLVSSAFDGKASGCTVNTLSQVTAIPNRLTVAVNKDNYTTEIIEKSGYFTGVALAQDATMELIGAFGFKSGRDTDKFAPFRTAIDENGVPYVTEQVVSRFSCKVIGKLDVGTHILFLGEVTAAETVAQGEPMTYAYYHKVRNGVTPPKASSYQPPAAKGFRCKVCGYVLESDTLPADYVCPVCGKGPEFFEPVGG